MEDLKINVLPNDNGEVIIRTGKALDEIGQNGYSISGHIEAPFEYYSKALEDSNFKNTDCILISNYDNGTLMLRTDPTTRDLNIDIRGTVELSEDIKELGINSKKTYSPMELGNKLKMYRSIFDSPENNMQLVSSLKKLKATVNTIIENEDDDKGNKKKSFEQRLESDLPDSFTLNCPIIKNGPKVSFKVDILREARDAGVSIWLQSVEMHELYRSEVTRLIDAEIEKMGDLVLIKQ